MHTSRTLLAFALCALAGCNVKDQEAITVAVYPTTQRCAIQEQPVDCAQVGPYLRDTLKIKSEREVVASFTGMDPGSKDDPILDRIAAEIRAAGFKHVRTARFDLQ
jgi:hypothetical protein